MSSNHYRASHGQAMVVLSAIISLLVIFVVGLFSYEVNRVEVCRSQLRSATEAAALAAAATLASQDNADPSAAHNEALQTALTTFAQNSVAGVALSNAIFAFSANDNPAPETSSLFIEFLDPNNNNNPVKIGDPAGKIVRVNASFGLKPSFGNFLGLPTVPLRASSSGGVPDLDVVLLFDVSGSIDDQTPVSFVRRQWTGSAASGKIQYIVPPARAGSAAGALAQGRLYDILGPQPTGTAVQAMAPQNLGQVSQSGLRWPLNFSESGTATGLRSRSGSDPGAPPGNMPPGTAGTGNTYTCTDIVVNIDGKSVFQGITTGDGYSFPDLATVVEAARGNLENQTVFSNSKANTGVPASITPRSGYQAKYQELARANLHPISDAQQAAASFFTIMNTNTVGHFSLICFTDNAGSAANTTVSNYLVDSSYRGPGSGNFPNPLIALSPQSGTTNYQSIQNILPKTTAIGGTNIGDAINKAVTQLSSNSRTGSKKAIVLFTDGMPTVGNPLSSDPSSNARLAAVRAQQAGIPIYSIGLAQNAEIIPFETQILTDKNSSSSSGGVSGIAGHGGKFFLVTKVSDLRLTFENIARQLVQLVH
ncbi:MAG: VWA domain-containing protein [Candidatus Obscuribacterales bacterium]|nr:VWA domain-containing protein [Candidatus Obscuribacterales bacterium]